MESKYGNNIEILYDLWYLNKYTYVYIYITNIEHVYCTCVGK